MSDKRVIGRWYIGETLGKGGYSWVKKGKDVKTGKTVALKFMEKADASWIKEQAQQVETEIDALKNIRHRNVMKLYAYNLNAQYPTTKPNKYLDTVLLVLEYAPGGELFDILYYTSKLEPVIARTYFKQLIEGLEACHKAQVVHRDLKPQNLLLDAKYNLKITDFGLSKVIQSDEDAIMKTSYVGTRGYQAPELLLKKKYDLKCDIFSAGVILFILLAGYPPFEQAYKDDKWYKPLTKENYEKFWKHHAKSQPAKNSEARDLLQKMLSFDPQKRASIADIKKHNWFNGEILKQDDLIRHLRLKHMKAEEKRRQDVVKMKDLAHSIKPNRTIEGLNKMKCPMFPEDRSESVHCVYTYGNVDTWKQVYNFIEQQILEVQGEAEFNPVAQHLVGTMNIQGKGEIKFIFKVMVSREWANKKSMKDGKADDVVYVIETRRLSGNFWAYNAVKTNFLLQKCSFMTKGLPHWASKLQKMNKNEVVENKKQNDDEKEIEKEDEDEYYKIAMKELKKEVL